jgi:hypothetical protein
MFPYSKLNYLALKLIGVYEIEADIEKRLIELHREIHSILSMLRKKGRNSKELV